VDLEKLALQVADDLGVSTRSLGRWRGDIIANAFRAVQKETATRCAEIARNDHDGDWVCNTCGGEEVEKNIRKEFGLK
jgi:hypothetical protein